MSTLHPEQCDDCTPPHLSSQELLQIRPALAASSIPFLLTFVLVALFAWLKLFPALSGHTPRDETTLRRVPSFKLSRASISLRTWAQFIVDRAAAITFCVTIALSAVLAELIFCEISNIINPAARKLALELTISILLVSLVFVTPALEIHSLTSAISVLGSGWRRLWLGLILDCIGLAAWLASFWWVGKAVIHKGEDQRHGFSRGSLERIGVIGVSLMASLAGFAAISSVWQAFGVKVRRVTEAELARKKHGLEATRDLLLEKQSRLRALERKTADQPQPSFFGRMVGSIRGQQPDLQEMTALQLEISGLESMSASLSQSLAVLQSRRSAQQAAGTPYGRLCLSTSYVFSLYCVYRIGATSTATLRRWWSPSTTFASTDPINNVLALVAKHWDPELDRAAWSRQISFLLSGVMLLASFNAVLQTVLLFSRFTPTRLLQSAQQNLALLVSQISATYVVSSALLLRSNLPKEMGTVIEGALGDPLDTAFVERWFEGWFLAVCAVTTLGIWVSRTVGSGDEWDDDYDDPDIESAAGKKRRA